MIDIQMINLVNYLNMKDYQSKKSYRFNSIAF